VGMTSSPHGPYAPGCTRPTNNDGNTKQPNKSQIEHCSYLFKKELKLYSKARMPTFDTRS